MLSTAALLLTLTIYHEARGEPQICQRYVADTVFNRMKQSEKSADAIIKERNQYQWMSLVKGRSLVQHYRRIQTKGQPADKKALEDAVKLAHIVLSSEYVPANKGMFFQTVRNRIPSYYGGHFRCGGHNFSKK